MTGTKGRSQIDKDLVINPHLAGVLKEPTNPPLDLGGKRPTGRPRLKEHRRVCAVHTDTQERSLGCSSRRKVA
jgi:hypothetical protein